MYLFYLQDTDFSDSEDSEYLPSPSEESRDGVQDIYSFDEHDSDSPEGIYRSPHSKKRKRSGTSPAALTPNGKTKTKTHFCFLCGKEQARLPRHLSTIHKSDKRVFAYLEAVANNDAIKTKAELTKLRNLGDYYHNIKVQREGCGEIVSKRRKPGQLASPSNSVHCPDCYGFFQKGDLYRHKCPSKSETPRRRILKKGQLLLHSEGFEGMEPQLHEFWGDMRQDAILLAAKHDTTINELVKSELKKKDMRKFNLEPSEIRHGS